MMIASIRARLIVAAIALILMLPIVGIRRQDDAILAQFHRHSLSEWPSARALLADPPQYFVKARAWLGERVYPIRQASTWYDTFLYFVLDTPPRRNITLGDDGFVFLNGAAEAGVNGLFDSVCVRAHTATAAASLRDALTSLAGYALAKGIAVDVVVVPTSATLYGDRVPVSVSPAIRNACRERGQGGSPLLNIRPPPGIAYTFPFTHMQAARGDDAFFPKGNWHAKGLSLQVVRDDYLASIGVQVHVDDTLQLTSEPSEVLANYGRVNDNRPVYDLINNHVRADATRAAQLMASIADLLPNRNLDSHYYRNAQAPLQQSVLMLSDSYGNLSGYVFAGVFQNVFQITCNFVAPEKFAELVERISQQERTDRIILLTEEGQAGMISGWARGLAAAKPPAAPPLAH